jgi:hypothetical protein
MKMNVKAFILIVSISVLALNRISAQSKNDLIGKWDAFIPLAPEEFQKSVVKITQDSVFMSTDGMNFAPANSVEFKNDTLNYEMNEASFTLTFESDTKMKGIAKWGSGQSELTLTKKENTDFGSKNMKP